MVSSQRRPSASPPGSFAEAESQLKSPGIDENRGKRPERKRSALAYIPAAVLARFPRRQASAWTGRPTRMSKRSTATCRSDDCVRLLGWDTDSSDLVSLCEMTWPCATQLETKRVAAPHSYKSDNRALIKSRHPGHPRLPQNIGNSTAHPVLKGAFPQVGVDRFAGLA